MWSYFRAISFNVMLLIMLFEVRETPATRRGWSEVGVRDVKLLLCCSVLWLFWNIL